MSETKQFMGLSPIGVSGSLKA